MKGLLLGIDIGTGSCKCSLIDEGGNLAAQAVQEYRPKTPKNGWAEQNPDEWYEAVCTCIKKMEGDKTIHPQQVAAVGVTGQMRGPTFLDTSGNPLRASILWNDQRCASEVSEIQASSENMLMKITHNPLNTMCTLPKLLWVLRNEPQIWKDTATVLYPKDYINFRLTGTLSTDHSNASGSSFYDLEKQIWSDEILEKWHLQKEKLPEIHSSLDVIGTITQRAHQETGLKACIPVVAGGSDATVEMLAIGIANEHQCKIRLGSSGALSTIVDQLNGRENAGYYIWSNIHSGTWMIDINTRACAAATVWLKDVFYQEFNESEEAFGYIGQEASEAVLGADGLFFHPYLLGEDAPYWQPHLRGSFFGVTASHGRAECARAVLEGTGFALRDARSMLKELVNGFQEYIFVGGGTRNNAWLQIVADILGVDGKVAIENDAAFGAAMLAGVASGMFSSLSAAIETCRHIEHEVKHDATHYQMYTELFDRYLRIKQALDAAY
jgi:xylulokinase